MYVLSNSQTVHILVTAWFLVRQPINIFVIVICIPKEGLTAQLSLLLYLDNSFIGWCQPSLLFNLMTNMLRPVFAWQYTNMLLKLPVGKRSQLKSAIFKMGLVHGLGSRAWFIWPWGVKGQIFVWRAWWAGSVKKVWPLMFALYGSNKPSPNWQFESGNLKLRSLRDQMQYSGQKKKLSAPEEGQNSPRMVKSQTFWVPVYSYSSWQYILKDLDFFVAGLIFNNILVQKKIVPHW